MNESEGTEGGQRRRRRRRTHGGTKQNNKQNNKRNNRNGNSKDDSTKNAKSTNNTKNAGNTSRNGSSGKGHNHSSASKGSSRSRNSSRGRGRPQRQSNRNTHQGHHSRQGRHGRHNSTPPDQHSNLPLSVEESAGGLVLSGLAEAVRADGSVDLGAVYVALIGRLDRRGRLLWSMPKGHVEPEESLHTTAEREVWEETGVHGEVIGDLGTIDYWFISEGVRIHKTVHHHLLRFVDGDLNDEDPEVTEVTWLPVDQLIERLAYADERSLARDASEQIARLARAEASAGRRTPR